MAVPEAPKTVQNQWIEEVPPPAQRTSPPAPSGLFCAHFVSINYKHTIS